MTPEELDRKARAWRAAHKAETLTQDIDRLLARSPRANAVDQLAWLERCALAGELGPGRELADYDVHEVVAAATGNTTRPLYPERR